MKAAVFVGPGQLELRDVPKPDTDPGGMLLRVDANTACGTDVRILRGQKSKGIAQGVVLGHEISGTVAEVGANVEGFAEGDRIGLLPTIPCGRCYYCRRGTEHLCTDSKIFGNGIDGGLAEYVRIPPEAILRGGVFPVEKHVPSTSICLAEPLGCALNGMDNYKVHVGDTVVILGAGPIGLLHLQLVKLGGAERVIVSDLSASRLALAEKLGADRVVNASSEDLEVIVAEATGGIGADLVIVCIGVSALVSQGLKCARKRGRVNLFAGFPVGGSAEFDPNLIHYGELEVTGASNAGRVSHERALRLIESEAVDVASLVTHTFPLDDGVETIEFSASGEGVKIAYFRTARVRPGQRRRRVELRTPPAFCVETTAERATQPCLLPTSHPQPYRPGCPERRGGGGADRRGLAPTAQRT